MRLSSISGRILESSSFCPVKIIIAILIFLFLFPIAAPAAENNQENNQENKENQENFVDNTHATISKKITRLATSLDSLLGTQRVDDKINKTKIRLSTVTTIYESKSSTTEANIKLNLTLPNTEKRFQLVIENYYDKNEDGSPIDSRTPTSTSIPRKESAGAQQPTDWSLATALRYITSFTGFRTTFDAGVRFTSVVQIFSRLRLQRDFPMGKWVFRPAEQFDWIYDEGLSSSTDIDFDRRLNEKWLFRLLNNMSWNDREDIYNFTNGPSFYQTVNERTGLSYNIRVQSSDTPRYEVNNYVVSVGLRQLLYQNWFFWTVVPAVSFPRELNFYRTPSLTIRFEAIFGRI
ncbi:hypothetical protein KKI24_03740 [bacterium]|nr:hypothetical protein [bacterium]